MSLHFGYLTGQCVIDNKIRNGHMRNVKKADRPGIVMEGVGVEK